ncbi:MAG: ComF family protein, partial [Eubacteriales bacterium]|nr:ComF family protein [Eubacteriales bacterium]
DIDYIISDKEPFLSVFEYNEKTKFSIHRLKYYNRPDYAKYFAKMMYLKFCKLENKEYDLIAYAPMHFKKKRKRGYDQAELLAKEFSKLANIKLSKNNLIRTKNTLAQSKVSYEERKSNVEGIFEIKDYSEFKNKNIILIDDIYTTGNTILQCAKEIKKAGANNICFLTLSKVVKE